MSESQISTATLVVRAQRGDREAYGQLAERIRPRVYALALDRLRNTHEAQELTQDVLVQAYVKLEQLKCPAAFGGWVRQMTVRMAINRATRKSLGYSAEQEVLEHAPASVPTPLDNLLHGERLDQVRSGLRQLSAMDRDTLLAFYFKGQSIDQISRQTSAPLGTIKRRLHVARNRLRIQLEQPPVEEPAFAGV